MQNLPLWLQISFLNVNIVVKINWFYTYLGLNCYFFCFCFCFKVKRHYFSILLKNVKEIFPPAHLTQPACLTGFPKICYPAHLIRTARLIGTWGYEMYLMKNSRINFVVCIFIKRNYDILNSLSHLKKSFRYLKRMLKCTSDCFAHAQCLLQAGSITHPLYIPLIW